jgi:hypothetical protein
MITNPNCLACIAQSYPALLELDAIDSFTNPVDNEQLVSLAVVDKDVGIAHRRASDGLLLRNGQWLPLTRHQRSMGNDGNIANDRGGNQRRHRRHVFSRHKIGRRAGEPKKAAIRLHHDDQPLLCVFHSAMTLVTTSYIDYFVTSQQL